MFPSFIMTKRKLFLAFSLIRSLAPLVSLSLSPLVFQSQILIHCPKGNQWHFAQLLQKEQWLCYKYREQRQWPSHN